MTSTQEQQITILNAEPEHDGIRLTVILALFLGLILGFFLINWLLRLLSGGQPGDFTLLISCVGAFPFAFLVIFLTEFVLKRTWHSGLTLELAERPFASLTLKTAQANDRRFELAEAHTQLVWYFSLKGYPRGGRERRPNKNWYCFAAEVQQDDEQLSLYAYLPPKKKQLLVEGHSAEKLHQIYPPELYDTSIRGRIGPPARPTIPTEVIRSQSGRYWLAERRRWQEGIELAPDDFIALVQFLDRF